MLRQIRLLIFDLDYLVFDCRLVKAEALRQSLIAFADGIPQHIRLPDALDIEAAFCENGHRWVRSLDLDLSEAHLADLEQVYQVYESRLLEAGSGRIFPGVTDVLSACRSAGIPTALGAEASRDYLMLVSDRHELDQYFDFSLCTQEYGFGCANEMLADILSRAEVTPSEALVLGTRPSFFDTSHSLDLLTIGCGWGIQQREALGAADFQAPSVARILPVVRGADEIAAQYAG